MQVFPTTIASLVNRSGTLLSPWIQYLQQFTQAPPKFVQITVDASPFSYTAKEPGYIVVHGGTVSAITLTRGTDNLNFTNQLQIPASINDKVTIVYSVLPTMTFIPIYGAAQR